MDMDEEKFSIERFLELMGDAPEVSDRSSDSNSDRFREAKSRAIPNAREGRSSANRRFAGVEGKLFHVEQPVETDVREWETIEKRAEAAEKDTPKPSKPREDRREVLRARAIARVEPPKEVAAKPRRAGLIGRAVEKVRRAFGWETGEVAERDENAERAGDAVFEDAEQVGARAEREWDEETARSGGHVWQGVEAEPTGRARNRRWTEDELSDGGEGRAKRVWDEMRNFAESDGVLTESRGKIAEFRKSDVDGRVDLRAISRAVERDSRRY